MPRSRNELFTRTSFNLFLGFLAARVKRGTQCFANFIVRGKRVYLCGRNKYFLIPSSKQNLSVESYTNRIK